MCFLCLLLLGGLLEEGLELPLEPSTKSDLARVAPLASATMVKRRATETWADEGVAQEESSAFGSEEVATHRSGCELDFSESRVP